MAVGITHNMHDTLAAAPTGASRPRPSRVATFSWFRALIAVFALALPPAATGCAGRAPPRADVQEKAKPPAPRGAFYVATTRLLPFNRPAGAVGDRSTELAFAKYAIPDPGEATGLSAAAFAAELSRRGKAGGNRVGVFVHGYNTDYEESVEHVAEMSLRAGGGVIPVLFAWPSQGRSAGYVHDRDAAAFSRDALARLLTGLAENRRIEDVTVFAHSMGAWLAMEALRQMRIGGNNGALGRLRVILAAPDIDIDLFRTQLDAIGPLARPLVLLVTPEDRILRLSAEIGGGRRRVGTLSAGDPLVAEAAKKKGVIVIDVSAAEGKNALNHDRYIGLAKRYKEMSPDSADSLLRRAGTYVFDAGARNIVPAN